MGRPITALRKANIRIKVNKEGYTKLVQLGQTVHNQLLANIADYAIPLPTLVALQAAVTALRTAASFMGHKRNRASKAQKDDAQLKATSLRLILDELKNYVLNTVTVAFGNQSPERAELLARSGFGFADTRSINRHAQIPRFMRQTNNSIFDGNSNRINWKRPIGMIKGAKVAGYNVYVNGKLTLTTTKCNAVITPPPGGAIVNLVVKPFNSRGEGNGLYTSLKPLA